jgi:hypothetical protein
MIDASAQHFEYASYPMKVKIPERTAARLANEYSSEFHKSILLKLVGW